MDHVVESSKHKLLTELDKINRIENLNPDALKNMSCIIDALHHIEEISMLQDVSEDYGGDYSRRGRGRVTYRSRYDWRDGDDMRAYLDEQMRHAQTEPERERIRLLMNGI